jgi:hypothetical protein
MNERCELCQCFKAGPLTKKTGRGACRLNPIEVGKKKTDWCYQFKLKAPDESTASKPAHFPAGGKE